MTPHTSRSQGKVSIGIPLIVTPLQSFKHAVTLPYLCETLDDTIRDETTDHGDVSGGTFAEELWRGQFLIHDFKDLKRQ